MAFKSQVSPSIRGNASTTRIMNYLLACLVIVFLYSLYVLYSIYNINYVIHAILLLVVSLVTSLVLECGFAKFYKKDIKKHLMGSYPWITSIILVLSIPVSTDLYPMFIATIFSILIAKLLFGGFGQNIFNPAAVGRVVLYQSFGAVVASDIVVGATPIASVAANNWTIAAGQMSTFLQPYGGWMGMLTGMHAGSMGETATVLILICGLFMAFKKVIDYRIPVVYFVSILLFNLIIGCAAGLDPLFPIFALLSGGVVFGGVFMLTDPVTSPVHPIGKCIFALGAAFLTVLIRFMASTPGGVMYAILIMNMLVPTIDNLLAGKQIEVFKKAIISFSVIGLLFMGGSYLIGNSLEVVEIKETTKLVESKVDGNNHKYIIDSVGLNKDGFNRVEVIIDTNSKTLVDVKITKSDDTPDFVSMVNKSGLFDAYKGKTIDNVKVDVVSGASYTQSAVDNAVKFAISSYKEGK